MWLASWWMTGGLIAFESMYFLGETLLNNISESKWTLVWYERNLHNYVILDWCYRYNITFVSRNSIQLLKLNNIGYGGSTYTPLTIYLSTWVIHGLLQAVAPSARWRALQIYQYTICMRALLLDTQLWRRVNLMKVGDSDLSTANSDATSRASEFYQCLTSKKYEIQQMMLDYRWPSAMNLNPAWI